MPVNCTEAELAEYLRNLRIGFTCEPCTYSPEPVGESSPTNSLGTPRSARSRSMSIASKSFRQGKRTAAFHGFPSLRMSSNLMVGLGAGWLMLSPVDSPAPIFHWPGRARVSMGSNQDCGPKWRESLARFDPVSRSWKTAQRSLLGDSGESSVIWPRSGMTADGQCWELPKSERPTSVTGSGLWPTPDRRQQYGRDGTLQMGRQWGQGETSDHGYPAGVKRRAQPRMGGAHDGMA